MGQPGHINPTLAFTQELVRTGNEVFYYVTPEFKTTVEATGAYFRSYESILGVFLKSANSQGAATVISQMPALWLEECQKRLPDLLTSIKLDAPEIIVYDFMCIVGRLIAEILRVPGVKCFISYASNEHCNIYRNLFAHMGNPDNTTIAVFETGIDQVCRQFDCESFSFESWLSHTEQLNIVTLPRSFQIMEETFNSQFEFVGPCIEKQSIPLDFPLEKQSHEPLIYISLGTLFNQWPEFFQMCVAAFGKKQWKVVMSCGHHSQVEALGSLPSNFIVQPYVPQIAVLEQADVFLSHGGMNSTMESLFFGVPLVIVPQAIDQQITAPRIQELGLGIHLPKEQVNIDSLVEAVELVLNDTQMKKQVSMMQSLIKASGGYKRAAELIQNFAVTSTRQMESNAIL